MEFVDCEKHGRQKSVPIGDPRNLHVVCGVCYSEKLAPKAAQVSPGLSIGVSQMTQPGEKVVQQNKDHKHAMGVSPNKVANTYLAAARGKPVVVYVEKQSVTSGILQEFDLYSFTVRPEGAEDDSADCLFFKGPGVWLRRT